MTNEEVMQLMTDMGLHEGGIENWVMDNAWVLVVNKAIAIEREACAALCFRMWNEWLDSSVGDDFLDTSNCPDAEDCAAAIRARGKQ